MYCTQLDLVPIVPKRRPRCTARMRRLLSGCCLTVPGWTKKTGFSPSSFSSFVYSVVPFFKNSHLQSFSPSRLIASPACCWFWFSNLLYSISLFWWQLNYVPCCSRSERETIDADRVTWRMYAAQRSPIRGKRMKGTTKRFDGVGCWPRWTPLNPVKPLYILSAGRSVGALAGTLAVL